MQPNKSVHRSVAILKLPNVIAALIAYAQAIITAMTNNPRLPSPVPALAVVTAANAALLQQLRMYVQTTADADPENSASIIQSAGMAVKKTAARRPRVFDAVQGAVSGTVKLVAASAGKRASYDWQYSTDGGKTWLLLPSTMQAKTSVTGLTPGATVQFRYRALTRTGEGDWSQPLSFLVK